MYTETLTQRRLIPNGIYPQSLNNSRASTAGVDMSKCTRAIFTLYIGAVTSGSISAWLQESSDNFSSDVPSNDAASSFSNSGGSGLSSTGNTTTSAILTFEVRADQLTSGKQYVRLQVKETAGSATIVCVVANGEEASNKPVGTSSNNGSHYATNGSQNVVNNA
jgi:hypothetical protein